MLETAARLFYRDGIRAVGLQQVIGEAGVGKSSVYREFPSKDDLVAAWLHASRAMWWERSATIATDHPDDPARQLLELVRAVYDEVAANDFRGCRFLNTSAEFRDAGHLGRQEAVEHLREVRAQLKDLAAHAGADQPDVLGDELMLLIDGMYATGAVLGPSGPAARGVHAAAERITLATGAPM